MSLPGGQTGAAKSVTDRQTSQHGRRGSAGCVPWVGAIISP